MVVVSDSAAGEFGTLIAKINGSSTDFNTSLSNNSFYNAYEAKEVIGRGISSTVRRCLKRKTGETFAVKVVDISSEKQNEQEAKRLLRETLSEIQLLELLKGHPSIISLYDHFITPTFIFAVFELAAEELFTALNRSVSFSEKKSRQVMRQLFEGVKYMHGKNIVHRDLKLENVLCIDDKRVVISDFGFAKQLDLGERLTDLFGTPGYLAPETIHCQMYEKADGYSLEVDNWALGVIMYTLLAGYAPFYHRQQLRCMRLIREGRYEFNVAEWENVSEEAKDLIRRMLTVDVQKRIQAADCLKHQWITMGAPPPSREPSLAAPVPTGRFIRMRPQLRHLFIVAIRSVLFIIRLRNLKRLRLLIDRNDLRKRPYRRREIRHEAEAAIFAVYGHWVNRGFHYSRDILFANKPKPKYINIDKERFSASK